MLTDETARLFARPTIFEGMGRLLDFGNTMTEYNRVFTAAQADYLAIRSDWRAVGSDIRVALDQLAEDVAVGETEEAEEAEEEQARECAGSPFEE